MKMEGKTDLRPRFRVKPTNIQPFEDRGFLDLEWLNELRSLEAREGINKNKIQVEEAGLGGDQE